jgi:tetratricopeptide (TPR) repeat protein
MLVDADGAATDWLVGYGPPPDKFLERLDKSLKGVDTFKSLSERYAKEPKNIEVLFKLGQKLESRYDEENQKKALDLFKQVIAIDPEGKMGTTEYIKEKVSYTEYAEFSIGTMSIFRMKGDPAPLKAFIKKYPESKIVKSAHLYLGSYYQNSGSKEEATQFFEEYISRYPQDPDVLNSYVLRIIRDKENLDKGIELGEKIREIMKYNPLPSYMNNLAELYVLKGDKAKAEELYGKDFMDGQISRLPYNLIDYARFWAEQKANTESAVAMAELALKLRPDNSYLLQSTARIYCQLDKTDKALEIYGPELIKNHWDKASDLNSYAWFWAGLGKNLDSALEAAKRAIELSPESYIWDTLSLVYSKLNRNEEALKAAEAALKLAEDAQETYFIPSIKQRIEQIKKAIAEKK